MIFLRSLPFYLRRVKKILPFILFGVCHQADYLINLILEFCQGEDLMRILRFLLYFGIAAFHFNIDDCRKVSLYTDYYSLKY